MCCRSSHRRDAGRIVESQMNKTKRDGREVNCFAIGRNKKKWVTFYRAYILINE